MDVSVIRHTRLDIDSDRCYGQSEVELAPGFAEELASYRLQLAEPFCQVYSSPLRRCTQLAGQFSERVETSSELLEYDFGDWEMKNWDDIDQQQLQHWMQDFVYVNPPNCETLVQMSARVASFIERLRAQNHERVLIVTHAGVIRCIWAHLLNIPLAEVFKLAVGYGEPMTFQLAESPEQDIVFTGSFEFRVG